jgi:hypothetical protein
LASGLLLLLKYLGLTHILPLGDLLGIHTTHNKFGPNGPLLHTMNNGGVLCQSQDNAYLGEICVLCWNFLATFLLIGDPAIHVIGQTVWILLILHWISSGSTTAILNYHGGATTRITCCVRWA